MCSSYVCISRYSVYTQKWNFFLETCNKKNKTAVFLTMFKRTYNLGGWVGVGAIFRCVHSVPYF